MGGGMGSGAVLTVLAVLAPPILAQSETPAAAACGGPLGAAGRVAAAGPGLGLIVEDGTRVALAGLMIPGAATDLVPAIEQRLLALVGETVRIAPTAAEADRHGRVPAIVVAADGDLALSLVAAGLAAAAPGLESGCREAFRAAESAARAAGRGLWQNGHGLLRADDPDLANRAPDMVIVEGRIVSVGESRGRLYLNFGENWSTDFTVLVPEPLVAEFRSDGIDPEALARRRVRVRGWMVARDGGYLELDATWALEILEG